MSTLATFIQHSFGRPSHKNQRKRKGIQVGNKAKLSLFADEMVLHIENPQYAARMLLEFINEFIEVAGYKTNTQKLPAFLFFFFIYFYYLEANYFTIL